MSQIDVLNPTPTHPLNPDYSFQKKRPLTHLSAKANHGPPYGRDITDIGHQFSLNWNDRLASDARKLKWYYEQYRFGFFTLIDHEGGGREYVGHFSTPVEPSPTAHNHWSVQQVLFDEVPGVPMRKYPNDWERDAIWELALNDFGDRMVAAAAGTWTLIVDSKAKSSLHFEGVYVDANPNFACYVYTGYGFQFWAPTGPAYGKAQIVLDGVAGATVDFYSAAAQASSMLAEFQNVSLGTHTVNLLPLNAKNAASTGYTVLWDALKVMR